MSKPAHEPPVARPTRVDDADAVLVAALHTTAGGDRRAFERLYRLTCVKLLAVCRRVLPDLPDAEEALQNAYLKVWRGAAAYDAARGRPMTWLITVAHHAAIDVLRRRRAAGVPLPRITGLEPAAVPDPDGARRLDRCLRILEQQDEAFLRIAFFEGATYPELAESASLPLGTVKSRIRRALLKLAECLR